MWELDYKESWEPKNWCFWTMVLEKALRSPWVVRRSNQSILKEISPKYLLEGRILKLKLQYFGHLMWRTNSLEKTLMLGKIEGGRRRGLQWMRQETCMSEIIWIKLYLQFSHSVMSNSLQPHGLKHARPPCPSPTSRVYSNSCPLSQWCHPTISSSVVPFSSCLQSFPASGSFPMSQFFASGD